MHTFRPVPNPTTPYYRTDLYPLDSHDSTEYLPTECDVLIIGKNLQWSHQVCSGATGCNGGHVKAKTGPVLKVAERNGIEQADKFFAFVGAQIGTLKYIVERERLDCVRASSQL
ncbi:hypothetical protein F4859DRAFT_514667 [Xylaria cf. heliscus]|nr:hypothetical protein F4859DRAFT_514667 [Xylaria cf. heliscus]